MRVKLLQMTQNPIDIMWTAARTCYSELSPIEIWNTKYGNDCEHIEDYNKQCVDKHWNLVKKVLSSGHQSVAEHVNFTFAIEGVSRALLAQLTRHRAGIVFSVQSQRYVEIKEDKQELMDILNRYAAPEMYALCDKYFVEFKDMIPSDLIRTLCEYRDLIEGGCKPEDARMVLPNAIKTNITMTVNLRELIHISNLRLCTRAQLEIRQLFQEIKKEVEKVEPRFAELLVPTCEVHGFCTEHQCCGRKPKLEDFKGRREQKMDLSKMAKQILDDWTPSELKEFEERQKGFEEFMSLSEDERYD